MEPMCGFANSTPAVAGSSRRSWTARWWASQAGPGCSAGDGTSGSWMSEPEATKPGSHSTRWMTTSRAVQPDTGAAADQSRVPCTRRVKSSAINRCRRAGSDVTSSEGAIGQHPVDRGVPVVDADLHAAAQPGVATLEGVAEGERVQAGVTISEVLEGQRLQRDVVGHALPGERLDDAVATDGVEAAAESLLVVVAAVEEAERASVGRVPAVDDRRAVVRADPPGVEVWVGVGTEQLIGGAGEVAPDVDGGDRRVGLDRGLVVTGVG